MNLTKQRAFNEKMGKAKHYPRHQNLSKGGMVDKRKHFADGGATTLAASQPASNINSNTQNGGLFGALTQQSGYNAPLAPTTQFNYAPTVGAASTNALNSDAVNNSIAAEQNLAGQYGQIAAGRGPNPALAALNQQTGVNVANTAALQAGQRGGAANVGLLARQIGQQGAATQQNAVSQAATLQANQQLGALGAQAGLQNQIAQQGLGEQGLNANLYGTAANANTGQNNTTVGNYGQASALNQATATQNAKATGQTQGGLLAGLGSGLEGVIGLLNKGGEVEHFDNGGVATAPPPPTINGKSVGSFVANVLQGEQDADEDDPTGFKSLGDATKKGFQSFSKPKAPLDATPVGETGGISAAGGLAGDAGEMIAPAMLLANQGGRIHPGPHKSHVANYLFAQGGAVGAKVPALVSPKEVYLNPHQVREVVERGADPMKIGHHFPGKDNVKKNSQKNDVLPVELEDGGVVLPISVTTHKQASEKGRKFVEKAHAKRYMKKPKGI